MIDKVQKQPHPKTVAGPRNSSDRLVSMPASISSQDRIRERSYELYESRGCEFGRDEQDWLRAEQEILKQQQ